MGSKQLQITYSMWFYRDRKGLGANEQQTVSSFLKWQHGEVGTVTKAFYGQPQWAQGRRVPARTLTGMGSSSPSPTLRAAGLQRGSLVGVSPWGCHPTRGCRSLGRGPAAPAVLKIDKEKHCCREGDSHLGWHARQRATAPLQSRGTVTSTFQ